MTQLCLSEWFIFMTHFTINIPMIKKHGNENKRTTDVYYTKQNQISYEWFRYNCIINSFNVTTHNERQ